jgi:CheW-like domain
MRANDREPGAADGVCQGRRLMLVRAEGCRICVALDSVTGILELADGGTPDGGDRARHGDLPVVAWRDVVGVPPPEDHPAPAYVLVVRTPSGPVGLRIEACLGVQDVSFLGSPVLPTRLTDEWGEVRCFVHLIDRRPHFIVDPRALAQAWHEATVPEAPGRTSTEPVPDGGADAPDALS